MNQLRQLRLFLLIIVSSCISINTHEFQHKDVLTTYSLQLLEQQTEHQEGLVSSTLVCTSAGLIKVGSLQINDAILCADGTTDQKIVLIESAPVSYFYAISTISLNPFHTQNAVIYAAPTQSFYDATTDQWIKAKDLSCDHHIGQQRVLSANKIHKFTVVYKLTTDSHRFCIEENNILVHNANIATINALSIACGIFSSLHPVVAAIGRTVSLAKLAISLHSAYNDMSSQAATVLDALRDEDVIAETRSYYQTRRSQLLDLQQQYRSLQQAIQALTGQTPITNLLFASITTTANNPSLLPTVQTELSWSVAERQKLLQLQEQELSQIEREINSIQISLMIHFNDHIDRLNALLLEIPPAKNHMQQEWKKSFTYLDRNGQSNLAVQKYAAICAFVEVIDTTQRKVLLTQKLVQYYLQTQNGTLLKRSTNLVDLCNAYQQQVTEIQQNLPAAQEYGARMLDQAQQLVRQGLISQYTINNIYQNLQAQRLKKEESSNTNSKIKQSQIQFQTPPNDPDPEDKNEQQKKNFKKHPHDDTKNHFPTNERPHGLRNDEGHFLDTPTNRNRILNLARDKNQRVALDRHGNMWYAREESDGQLWASVRIENAEIQNCGLNKISKDVNPTTGLCKPSPTAQGKK